MTHEKSVDESWKESAAQEKEKLEENQATAPSAAPQGQDENAVQGDVPAGAEMELNFVNYVTSLALQAMIFLGQIPNPMADNKVEQNLPQAKFLIDTLLLIRDKTKGNLSKEEEGLLNGSLYELQMQYVQLLPKEEQAPAE